MRVPFVLLSLALVSARPVAAINNIKTFNTPNGQVLCPEKGECYPKIFEPQAYYQPIKEGQEVPAGLDIRINMETSGKEARLPSHHSNNEVALPAKQEYELTYYFNQLHSSPSFAQAVDSLETILDFSHDYSHGYKLVANDLDTLRDILISRPVWCPLEHYDKVRDCVLRILAGSLRNNPPALSFVASWPHTPEFLVELKSLISTADSLVTKRTIALFNAMLQDHELSAMIKLPKANLLSLYEKAKDVLLKERILEIVGAVADSGNSKRDNEEVWFKHIQEFITTESLEEYQKKNLLKKLVEMKQEGKYKPSSEFLNWMADEIDARQKKRDFHDEELTELLKETRHQVFGNKMVRRYDEF